jgi:hypothetical protein
MSPVVDMTGPRCQGANAGRLEQAEAETKENAR